MKKIFSLSAVAAAALVMTGCASVNIDQTLKDINDTNNATQGFTQGKLELIRSDQQQKARIDKSKELLAKPLSREAAVELALANSPAVQSLLAQSWVELAQAHQQGRIANPVFAFERFNFGNELELNRLLTFGLLDILTLGQRQGVSRSLVAQAKVQLSVNVVEQVTQTRQAWVRAVAAEQTLQYAEQVNDTAQAGAELARRMQQAGNFNKLQRVRQQVFYADATAQLASARHTATAAREELTAMCNLGLES